MNYLTVLAWGRSVLLMDTAILQSKFPKHKLFKLKCFQLPAEGRVGTELQQKWKQYRDDVVAAHNRTPAEHLEVCSFYLFCSQCHVLHPFGCCKPTDPAMCLLLYSYQFAPSILPHPLWQPPACSMPHSVNGSVDIVNLLVCSNLSQMVCIMLSNTVPTGGRRESLLGKQECTSTGREPSAD